MALACLCYNTGVCEATGMKSYQAMFGVEAFTAWGEGDRVCFEEEPTSMATRRGLLHRQLLGKAGVSRARAKKQYDKKVNPEEYKFGDRVLLYSIKLGREEGNKIVKPWIGPYRVTRKMGHVGYELAAETVHKLVRVHANRLRRISDRIVETVEPQGGMFPDSLRTLDRINDTADRRNKDTGREERHFRVKIRGGRGTCWTPESDFPPTVADLYDERRQQATTQNELEGTEATETTT